jgi:hypothetical protein
MDAAVTFKLAQLQGKHARRRARDAPPQLTESKRRIRIDVEEQDRFPSSADDIQGFLDGALDVGY